MKQVSAVLEHALGGRGSRRQLTLRVRKSRTKTTAAKSQFSEPSQRNEPRGGLGTGTRDVSWGKGMKSRPSSSCGQVPCRAPRELWEDRRTRSSSWMGTRESLCSSGEQSRARASARGPGEEDPGLCRVTVTGTALGTAQCSARTHPGSSK